jgi:hypothetical protein
MAHKDVKPAPVMKFDPINLRYVFIALVASAPGHLFDQETIR